MGTEAKVIVYTDYKYEGSGQELELGVYSAVACSDSNTKRLNSANDTISSIKIPYGYQVTIYRDYLSGPSKVLYADIADLSIIGQHDIITCCRTCGSHCI